MSCIEKKKKKKRNFASYTNLSIAKETGRRPRLSFYYFGILEIQTSSLVNPTQYYPLNEALISDYSILNPLKRVNIKELKAPLYFSGKCHVFFIFLFSINKLLSTVSWLQVNKMLSQHQPQDIYSFQNLCTLIKSDLNVSFTKCPPHSIN